MIFWITTLSGILFRSKYYVAFTFIQINLVICGIAYGKDKNGKDIWNNVLMCDLKMDAPFMYSFRERINMWNHSISVFFRYFLYNRLAPFVKDATVRSLTVFFANAVWHGIYPGYYVCASLGIGPAME